MNHRWAWVWRWVRLLLWLVVLAPLVALMTDLLSARRYQDPHWIRARVDRIDALRETVQLPVAFAEGSEALPQVWVFGASSVAAPSREAFTEPLLEVLRGLEQPVVVHNFGVPGLTSWSVVQRVRDVREAAAGRQPDLVVLYTGHNDVTYTYHAALGTPGANPWSYPFAGLVAGVAWTLASADEVDYADPGAFRWYRHRFVPPMLMRFQRAGLLRLRTEDFAPLEVRVREAWADNVEQMLSPFVAAGVPVLLVTPVGALAWPPAGALDGAVALYEAGMAEPDYAMRMRLLRAARDAELFTSDMRAKSSMLDHLRRRAPAAPASGVAVALCDVEAAFDARELPWDTSMFVDPLHFSTEGYAQLTEVVGGCIAAMLRDGVVTD